MWLVGFGVVNSVISLYYYLLVIRQMYIGRAEITDPREARLRVPLITNGVLGVLTLGVFFVGLYPLPLLKATDKAVSLLFPA